MSVSRAEYVEVLIAERMRLATGGAPQRPTLKLASPTRPLVTIRHFLHTCSRHGYYVALHNNVPFVNFT